MLLYFFRSKKVIIHVPLIVKNIKHTHTIHKVVKPENKFNDWNRYFHDELHRDYRETKMK